MDGFQERKVSDLEKQVEVLEKERKQRTFQMETCEQMFESQKRKTEDEKAQNVQVKRELQSLEDRYIIRLFVWANFTISATSTNSDWRIIGFLANSLSSNVKCSKILNFLQNPFKRNYVLYL